jgi:hypothetical protein
LHDILGDSDVRGVCDGLSDCDPTEDPQDLISVISMMVLRADVRGFPDGLIAVMVTVPVMGLVTMMSLVP